VAVVCVVLDAVGVQLALWWSQRRSVCPGDRVSVRFALSWPAVREAGDLLDVDRGALRLLIVLPTLVGACSLGVVVAAG
jgi:hypothetical protein